MEAIMYSTKGDQHLLISNYHRFFNMQMFGPSNPCTPCTPCFYHDFRGSQVLALARKVTLGLPRLLVVEEFPNKALLFGSSLKLVNCKAKDCSIAYYTYYDYIRIIDVYANDAKYCVYI